MTYNLDQKSFDHIFHKNLLYLDNIYDFYIHLFYFCFLLNGVHNNTSEIFKNPIHDYTKTLLKAIPEPDPEGREQRKLNRLNS